MAYTMADAKKFCLSVLLAGAFSTPFVASAGEFVGGEGPDIAAEVDLNGLLPAETLDYYSDLSDADLAIIAEDMSEEMSASVYAPRRPPRRAPPRQPPPRRPPPRRPLPPPRPVPPASYVCYAENEFYERFQGHDRYSAAVAQRLALETCYVYSRSCRALGCTRY